MRAYVLATACLLAPFCVQAEEETSAEISLELNTLTDVQDGCQVTFVASSGHAEGVDAVVFETVLFDAGGAVERLTLFDFGAIPGGVPRVRQFVIPSLECAALGQLLINGVSACSGPGLSENACARGLRVSSRTAVELIG